MKLKKAGAVLAATLGLLAGRSWAAISDQITLTVVPQAAVNVVIATGSVDWGGDSSASDTLNVGTLATGATAYMISPATVTYTGTYNNAEMELGGAISGGMTLNTSLTDASNALQVFTLFSGVSVGAPTPAQYNAAADHLVQTGAAIRVGAAGSDNNDGNYLNNGYDATDNEN